MAVVTDSTGLVSYCCAPPPPVMASKTCPDGSSMRFAFWFGSRVCPAVAWLYTPQHRLDLDGVLDPDSVSHRTQLVWTLS